MRQFSKVIDGKDIRFSRVHGSDDKGELSVLRVSAKSVTIIGEGDLE